MKPNTANLAETTSYIVDCTLATAERLAMRKNPSKAELWRQLNIAGYGIEALEGETDPPHVFACRSVEVVKLWADTPLSDALRSWAQDIHSRTHKRSSWKLGSEHQRIT